MWSAPREAVARCPVNHNVGTPVLFCRPCLVPLAWCRVLVSPRLEGLTELRLQLSTWGEAEGTVEAERLLGRNPCPAAEVMVRIIRPLTALQVRLRVEGRLLLPPPLPQDWSPADGQQHVYAQNACSPA